MDTKRTVERNSAVIILSHGRADNMITIKTLSKVHYTGKLYILIDDQDPQGDEYKNVTGKKLLFSAKTIILRRATPVITEGIPMSYFQPGMQCGILPKISD